jgi:hypothetical protein
MSQQANRGSFDGKSAGRDRKTGYESRRGWDRVFLAVTQPLDLSHRMCALTNGRYALYLKCMGVYEIGSPGYAQADQIYTSAVALLRATHAACVLLDYTELDYQWGDDLWLTFQIEHPQDPRDCVPHAVIVGPRCSTAIKSLLEDDGGYDSWLDAGYVFFDEAPALEYLARRLQDVEPGQS